MWLLIAKEIRDLFGWNFGGGRIKSHWSLSYTVPRDRTSLGLNGPSLPMLIKGKGNRSLLDNILKPLRSESYFLCF